MLTLAFIDTLVAAPSLVAAQTMDPSMPGMAAMEPDAKPTEAQSIGVVNIIDVTKGSIRPHKPHENLDDDTEPRMELNQPAGGLSALIAHWAAKARL